MQKKNQECASKLIHEFSSTSDIQPVCYVISKTFLKVTILMYQHKLWTHDKKKSILAHGPEVYVKFIDMTIKKIVTYV